MDKSALSGEQLYLAVIGDIQSSRLVARRGELQERLAAACASVNHKFRKELTASLVITLGDEFQGLLKDPQTAVGLLIALEEAIGEIPVRYGLGWGTLTTALRRSAIGMDGPCFHRAREALLRGKKEGRWVTVGGFGVEEDRILNGLFGLLGSVREEWSQAQRETVRLMRTRSTQRDVAKTRGVAVSTVHKALQAARYAWMVEAEEAAALLLARLGGRTASKAPHPPDGSLAG